MSNNKNKAEVIDVNDLGIDLSDIRDDNEDLLLEEEPDKAKKSESKKREKLELEMMKEEKMMMREQQKEQKNAMKEKQRLEEDLGLAHGIDAQKIRAQICRYRGHPKIGKFLQTQGFKLDDKYINKLDQQGLEDLLGRIRFATGNRNSDQLFKSGIIGGIHAFEYVGQNYLDMKIQGLTATLNQSEQFNDIVDEIMLEHQLMIYTRPEVRLAYLVLSTSLQLHTFNDQLAKMSPQQREELAKRMNVSLPEIPADAKQQAKSGSTFGQSVGKVLNEEEAPKKGLGMDEKRKKQLEDKLLELENS